jgi:hypothetical protein
MCSNYVQHLTKESFNAATCIYIYIGVVHKTYIHVLVRTTSGSKMCSSH